MRRPEIVTADILSHTNRWKQVAKEVKSRSGDQCWKRWNDSLDPHLNHAQWSPSEDAILEQAVLRSGRLWSKIANDSLPGRSGLSCKNRWDHIQRKQRRIHQSQREMLQSHPSSRSLLDSAILSDQRTTLPRTSSQHSSSGINTNHSHNRISSLSDMLPLPRHGPAPVPSFEAHHSPIDYEEDARRLMVSTGGAHFYGSTPQRPIHPRPSAPFGSCSWGGMTAGGGTGNALSPYISHTGSYSSPKNEPTMPPATTTTSSSPYTGPSLNS
jgi:hypothetical protein